MSIRVLGCSGAIAAGCRTTSFLLDDSVLIDAGTGVGDLSLTELARIDHIFISHSHLDHVVSIALLADAVMRQRLAEHRPPICVHALQATIDTLKAHVFNGLIWPDFTRLPSAAEPALKFVPFTIGEHFKVCGRMIEVLPAAHTVPAVGFAVTGDDGVWAFTGDTGPNPALWQRLAQLEVAHLVIETAFGDEERDLARISGHLCPTTLAAELRGLAATVKVHITHIKPGENHAVMGELHAMPIAQSISALQAGQVIDFG